MIIVKLSGGLGNQLFQYAVGRQLAKLARTQLKLDILSYNTYKVHDYSLPHFNIQECIASKKEINELKHGKIGSLARIFPSLIGMYLLPSTYIKEKEFQFNPEILKRPDGVYLDGYWQNEKYFSGIEDEIRQELTVNKTPRGKNKELGKIIMASSKSVCIHIRRGDYTQPKTRRVHGLCSLDYYYKSVELICQKVKNPHFFIFSNDMDWVYENLKISSSTTLVEHNNSNKDYEDLRLMTKCSHHIIANSTFSWWAAWLSNNLEKIVIAPKKWFVDKHLNSQTKDLFPKSWIKI